MAIALVACDKGADPNAPRDYTDDEIAELESRLMTRLTANQQRHCVRPVLAGDGVRIRPSDSTERLEIFKATAGINSLLSARGTTVANNTLTIQPPLWAQAVHSKEPPWSVACP